MDVPPERLTAWLLGFEGRHGTTTWEATSDLVVVTAQDGARAECEVPFPPLALDAATEYGGLPGHAARRRRIGVLYVRLGGYAAGVFDGATLIASKVGSRHVHGRSAAGGQSQKRFARRRNGQIRVALKEAADVAVRVLAPVVPELDAVVLGGDRRAVTGVLADVRLAGLRPLVVPRLLDVPDPARARGRTAAVSVRPDQGGGPAERIGRASRSCSGARTDVLSDGPKAPDPAPRGRKSMKGGTAATTRAHLR